MYVETHIRHGGREVHLLGFDSKEECEKAIMMLGGLTMEQEEEEISAEIKEFAKDDDKLSVIDIKAAIAEQGISVSDLFSRQDLSSDSGVVSLVQDAKVKVKQEYVNENVLLKKKTEELQSFKDKTDTLTLVNSSKSLVDKDEKIINYIRARLSSGRGVDLTGDLSADDRQEKVNVAITEELKLIEEQGITFKKKEGEQQVDKSVFDEENEEETDYLDPANNPLIPQDKDE